MRAEWELDELIDAWTLVEGDWKLVGDKTGAGKLGFALILKFYGGCGQGKHRTRHEWNHDLVVTVLVGLALRAVRVGRRRAGDGQQVQQASACQAAA